MIFKVLLVIVVNVSLALAVIRDEPPRELTVPLNRFAGQSYPMSIRLEPPYESRQYLAPPPPPPPPPPSTTTPAPIYTQAIYKPKPLYREPIGYLSSHSPSRSYKFGYKVHSPRTGTHFGHSESRQNHIVHGKYFVQLPDGRLQTVVYTADEHGYHPIITYS